MTKKVFIKTFGCQMNEYDSDKMADVLGAAQGYEPTDDPEAADLILFSSEPYRFQPADLETFAHDYDCPLDKLRLIDGEMTSWYGSRAIAGLNYLAQFAGAESPTACASPAGNPAPGTA